MNGFLGNFMGSISIILGWTGILWEFVRPGGVIPGAAGGVLLLFGLSRMLPAHPGIALATNIPFIVVASWLLTIAWKARKNKRSL